MQICYYRITPITDSIRFRREEEKKKRQKRRVKIVWIEVEFDKGQCRYSVIEIKFSCSLRKKCINIKMTPPRSLDFVCQSLKTNRKLNFQTFHHNPLLNLFECPHVNCVPHSYVPHSLCVNNVNICIEQGNIHVQKFKYTKTTRFNRKKKIGRNSFNKSNRWKSCAWHNEKHGQSIHMYARIVRT